MSSSIPARAMHAVRPSACAGLLAVSAVVAAVFTSAPFAIDAVAERYGVSAGMASLTSTAQMAGFTIASVLAGRRLRVSPRLALVCAVALIAANAVSAATPWFSTLIVARTAAGAVMGVLTWIAWADSASSGRRRGEVAAVGPLAATVSAPVIALVCDAGGAFGLYAAMAALGVLALFVPVTIDAATLPPPSGPPPAGRRRDIGATLTVLALGLLTMGGSAVFIFATVIGRQEVGLSPFAVSMAFSLNAVAGIPAARFAGRRRAPGAWMAVTALCGLLVTVAHHPVVFFVAMTVWGLAFWVAVPEAFAMLADRSASPDQRVGDAQAVMSAGRIIGPVVGGVLLQNGSLVTLGVVSAVVTLGAAAAVEAIATAHRWWQPAAATPGVGADAAGDSANRQPTVPAGIGRLAPTPPGPGGGAGPRPRPRPRRPATARRRTYSPV